MDAQGLTYPALVSQSRLMSYDLKLFSRLSVLVLGAAMIAGCASLPIIPSSDPPVMTSPTVQRPASNSAAVGIPGPVRTPAPPVKPLPAPVSGDASGLAGLDANALVRQFGKARIDLAEGDARKLQFASDVCVLDVFLYPTMQSRQPVATHVEARRPSDGAAVDPGQCAARLRAR